MTILFYYPEVNNAFLAQAKTDYISRTDYPEWHKGRTKYYVWAIAVNEKNVLSRMTSKQHQLAPFLLPNYSRQAHITLAACGFLEDKKHYDDDIVKADLKAQINRLKRLHLQPFTVDIAGINSFSTVPFLEVVDSESCLSLIRKTLLVGKNDYRTQVFTPHLTLGFYQAAFSTQQLNKLFATELLLPITVNSIAIFSYDAQVFASSLQLEQEIIFSH